MRRKVLGILATHIVVTLPWSITITMLAVDVHPLFRLAYLVVIPGVVALSLLVADAVQPTMRGNGK